MIATDILKEADQNYNAKISMLGAKFHGPGYHSLIPSGTWTHSTRDSIYYALHLLKTDNEKYTQRALDIIAKIISLQDTNSYSPTYGIWSWVYEEPIDQMSPPDWNWADFIGIALAHILIDFNDKLPQKLYNDVTISIGHAARSIFRRNVQPNYTNIAIAGTVVSAVAGELLNEFSLVEYARKRIKTFINYTKKQGGLNEYNSPGYTFVALHETERIIHLVNDPEIKKDADELRHFIWKSLSEHFHPKTQQLSGPHSRTYSDLLNKSTLHYIHWAISEENNRAFEVDSLTSFMFPLPCPNEFRQRFLELPAAELEQKDRFIKKSTKEKSFYGTTWLHHEVALGSINHECFWTQRRPLIGYWLHNQQVTVLRLRILKDGKDFATGGIENVQSANKILTGIKFYTDRGDYHIHLDRADNGIFNCKSLVLRYELIANGAVSKNLGSEQYELIAGNWKAVITAPSGIFNDVPVTYRIGKTQHSAYIEAILYEGEETPIVFNETTFIKLFLATELLNKDRTTIKTPIIATKSAGLLNLSWKTLDLLYNPYGEIYEVS